MPLMMAAELAATGDPEMFWFQGLSDGNRFDPSSEPRAVGMGIARSQIERTPTYAPVGRETIPYWDCNPDLLTALPAVFG